MFKMDIGPEGKGEVLKGMWSLMRLTSVGVFASEGCVEYVSVRLISLVMEGD